MRQKQAIDLETAKKVAAAAEGEADSHGWQMVIAIVDEGGHLMYLQRDGAQLGSIEVAMKKARAALLYRRSTRIWQERVEGGQLGCLEMPGVIPLEGGEILEYNGEVVGAIGVSGAQANEDGIAARAGAAEIH